MKRFLTCNVVKVTQISHSYYLVNMYACVICRCAHKGKKQVCNRFKGNFKTYPVIIKKIILD